MSKPFDATLKDLGREHPRDFLATFDQPSTQPVTLLNVDLSTVTTAADLVIGLGDPLNEILHFDFQASAAAWKHIDILVYQSLLFGRYRVPVHSMVVLLRPQAAHSNMDGTIRYAARPGRGKMDFGYEVIPLWERPANELLAGDLGTLPLALLGKLPAGVSLEEGMADVLNRLVNRLLQEAVPEQTRKLLTCAFVLSGLRLEKEAAEQLFRGAKGMQESSTYPVYLAIRAEEAKRILFLLGEDRFGPVDGATRARITAIEDLDQLEALLKRLDKASSWPDVLQMA
jgi:hypothetical protein